MKKRLFAMILAVCMLITLCSACESNTETAASVSTVEQATYAEDSEPAENTVQSEDSIPSEDAAPVEESVLDEETASAEESVFTERVTYDLPLFDEPQSFRYFCTLQGQKDSKYDFEYWNQLAEKTNVVVEYIEVSEMSAAEQYNLVIASGDLPEVIWEGGIDRTATSSLYPGGYDLAISDGVYLDLTDYISENCPNYMNLLEQYPDVRREITTDNGALFCFTEIFDSTYTINMGPFVRQDVLDAAGITEIPTTVEGWYDCFAAMKITGICEVLVRSDNNGALNCNFPYAFGTTGGSKFLVDNETNELFYDSTSDYMRAYLDFFMDCYSNGYLDIDFITSDQTMAEVDSGRLCMFDTMATAALNQMGTGHELSAITRPVLEGEDAPLLADYASHTTTLYWCCVTTAAEENDNIDVILKWFDYLYSDEGSQAANFGYDEGVSYEIVDGNMQLLPKMLDRDENNFTGVMIYTMKEGPSYFHWDLEYNVQTETWKEIANTWISVDTSNTKLSTLPSFSLKAEDSEKVSSRLSDIETYVYAQLLKWMTCSEELTDASWDAYVKTVEDMGIDEILSCYSEAYHNYMSR